MSPAVIATLPAPQAPGTAAGEDKPGRRTTDAQPDGEFSAVLAAAAGAAAPRVQAEETPSEPGVAGSGEDAAEGHGAEVVTPAAAGTVPGPNGCGAGRGASVALPRTAAHSTPVRGEHPAVPAMAGPPPPAGTAAAPEAPAPDAAGLGPSVPEPAGSAAGPAPGTAGEDAAAAPLVPSGDKPAAGKAPVDPSRPDTAPAEAASPRAQAVAGQHDAPGLRPAEPPRSPRADPAMRPGGNGIGAEVATGIMPAPGPPPAAPVGGPAPGSPPAPPAGPSPAAQVVEVIKPLARTEDGAEEVILELRPADLGTVRVEVRVEGGVVHATLRADQDSTADLLRQSLPELRDQLADAGLRPGDLGCDNGRSPGKGAGSQERPAWGRDPGRDAGTPAEPALAHRPADPRSSLDLLL